MKFLHISDIHLNKTIFQYNLLEIQKDLLDQVIDYMNLNKIDILVMAGDIYDRSVPSEEAISVLDEFLNKLINIYHKKVLMIAGNHDSATRLAINNTLLEKQGLTIVGKPTKKIKKVVIDNVNFYLVPYITPSDIKVLFDNTNIKTYEEAFKYYLDQQDIDYNQDNVLVAHQFFGPKDSITRSESESVLSIGGVDNIGAYVIENFTYSALGHIHTAQKVGKDYCRYAGSLMTYAFEDINKSNGMVEVEISNHQVSFKQISLKPTKELIVIEDTFDNILNNTNPSNDLVSIKLLDDYIIPNVKTRLKKKYPNILQIQYPNYNRTITNNKTRAENGFEHLSPVELTQEFYYKMTNKKMTKEEMKIINDIFGGIKK
ncbi:MAG: exonuclease SbcCD subunit D [Thomasclavelia sp.]|nr:exonuclease SbcCD subunit D [Thomasclavelia sp.]